MDTLIVWSARAFVFLYLVRVAMDLLISNDERRDEATRMVWTVALAVYLLHVSLAFHFQHGWSHAAALAHSGRRTWETTGIQWGGGIYVNYAFTLFWLADVAWWWRRSLRGEPTPRWAFWTAQLVFAFMIVNATVVFGPPVWRWIGPAAVVGLIIAACGPARGRRLPAAHERVGDP